MDDEKLLECVRKYPVVYDMTHPKYLDNKHNNFVWKTISTEINQTEEGCKKRWGNIRDQYKKHVNKRKTQSGQGANIIKKYKYEENLEFLLPHVQDLHTITSIESENEQTQDETEVQSAQASKQNETEMVNTNQQQQQQQQPQVILQPTTSPVEPTPDRQSPAQLTRSKNRKRRIITQSQPSASSTLMEYILKNNEKAKQDIHPIDAFFNGVSATVKNFSPYYQHLAKGKIFAVVQELELEQLPAEPSSYTSPMSGTSSNISMPVYTQVPIATLSPPKPQEPICLEPTPSTSTTVLLENNNMSTYFSHYTDN